jgi:protein-S-isoprenylcysteine O-methyltransferase Ste14
LLNRPEGYGGERVRTQRWARIMKALASLRSAIRPSRTRSLSALWAKSAVNAALFFAIFMVALPWLAYRLLPAGLPVAPGIARWLAGLLAVLAVAAWIACLDAFSRYGRGTPFPADAPRHLVTTGLFSMTRNPIMVAELSLIWAEALYFGSLGILVYAAAISGLAQLAVVYIEEPELLARFGEPYAAYCRNVPRWLPGLRSDRATNRAAEERG